MAVESLAEIVHSVTFLNLHFNVMESKTSQGFKIGSVKAS